LTSTIIGGGGDNDASKPRFVMEGMDTIVEDNSYHVAPS